MERLVELRKRLRGARGGGAGGEGVSQVWLYQGEVRWYDRDVPFQPFSPLQCPPQRPNRFAFRATAGIMAHIQRFERRVLPEDLGEPKQPRGVDGVIAEI